LTPVKLNILVESSGQVRIADFGFPAVTKNLDSVGNTTAARGHTLRWTAPEILRGGDHSQKGDIFSFAMVMVEVRHGQPTVGAALTLYRFVSFQVFTGIIPFSGSSLDAAAVSIMRGNRPERPTHPTFTEDEWSLMQNCWNDDHNSRPVASKVLACLEDLTRRRLVNHLFNKPAVAERGRLDENEGRSLFLCS
jgi:serine/threonine protein kinase